MLGALAAALPPRPCGPAQVIKQRLTRDGKPMGELALNDPKQTTPAPLRRSKKRVDRIADPKKRHPVQKGVLVLYIVYIKAFWHYM